MQRPDQPVAAGSEVPVLLVHLRTKRNSSTSEHSHAPFAEARRVRKAAAEFHT